MLKAILSRSRIKENPSLQKRRVFYLESALQIHLHKRSRNKKPRSDDRKIEGFLFQNGSPKDH